MKVLKSTLLIVICTLLTAGCVSTPAVIINPSQIFHGYPCSDHCQTFEAGYETAEKQNFTDESQCTTLSESLKLGCLSYLHSYQLANDQPAGYVFVSGQTADPLK